MKATVKIVLGFWGLVFAIIVALNTLIRVSDTSGSIGLIEHKLWGHSIWDFIKPQYSENYKRWKLASEASERVAYLLERYGTDNLIRNEEFETQRREAIKWSGIAYDNASAIPEEYLIKCNEEFSKGYMEYFVNAMLNWRTGFVIKDGVIVEMGVIRYNRFIMWMRTKNSEDLREMR